MTSPPPPPYSPLDPDNFSTASTAVPPKPDEPGFASETLLSRGLQIPSRSDLITSGFIYPDILAHYAVSREHWAQFTREITDEARLSSRQWTTAVGRGLGVLAVGGLMVGVFGAVPAVWVARRTRRNREEQNFIMAASKDGDEDVDGETGSRLSRKINRWNESFFRPRGIVIRVDLPWEELGEMEGMDISTSREFQQVSAGTQGITQRWRTKDDRSARESASRRARIVVIPLADGK